MAGPDRWEQMAHEPTGKRLWGASPTPGYSCQQPGTEPSITEYQDVLDTVSTKPPSAHSHPGAGCRVYGHFKYGGN